MVEIYINGQLVDSQIEDEETVSDVLKSFELTCEENEAAVIGIIVNGKQITAETFDKEGERRLTNNEKFEFSVVTKNGIKESFKKLSELFNELSKQMEKLPIELQKGNKLEVSQIIQGLADNVEEFSHLANLASLFPDTFNCIEENGLNIGDFFKDFSEILKDFEQALQNNDSVMIGDLAEYEICPRLQSISETLNKI